MDGKALRVFQVMIDRGLIPKEGVFEVTDELRQKSFETFREVFPPNRERPPRNSEIKFAKRLAGLNMMKLNEQRFLSKTNPISKTARIKQDCGFVYVISNPAFKGCYKIGITSDIEKRLNAYQTYDPYRLYKVEHYRFTVNKRKVEKQVLEKFGIDIINGEWITNDKVKDVFKELE